MPLMLAASPAQRRAVLIQQAALQRAQLAAAAAEIENRLWFVDRGIRAAARIERMPVLSVGVAIAAAGLVIKPRSAIKWISFAATAYSLARRLRTLLAP